MNVQNGEGSHALHYNVRSKRENGWSVVDPDTGSCEVTINTGALGDGTDTVTIQSGVALAAGETVSFGGNTVSIPAAQGEPRKDVIGLTDQGAVARLGGDQEPKFPENRELRYSERPTPRDLAEEDIVPLAIVSVPEDVDDITDRHIRDIRPSANYHVGKLNGQELSEFGGGSDDLSAHVGDTSNPHEVTAEQIGALPYSNGWYGGDFRVRGDNIREFSTDTTSNTEGDIMFDILKTAYARDDHPEIVGLSQVSYNTTGSGWYSSPDRYKAGIQLFGRSGTTRVPTFTTDHQGNIDFHGTASVDGDAIWHAGNLSTESIGALSTSGGTVTGPLQLESGLTLANVTDTENGLALDPDGDLRIGRHSDRFTYYNGVDGGGWRWRAPSHVGTVLEGYVDTGNVEVPNGELFVQSNEVWHAGNFDPSSLESGDTSDLENTAVVSDAANLQTALDNNDVVRIDGQLDLTAEPTITVPQDRVVYGHGVTRDAATRSSDILLDNKAAPTLDITGNTVHLRGFAVVNSHAEGIGIMCNGYSPNLKSLEIEAGYKGVQFGDPTSDTTPTEPRMEFCRVFSNNDAPGDGSIGIHVAQMYDSKILNNIVSGFDVGIQVDDTEAEIMLNHTYAYPSSAMTVGIQINARWVRCYMNRVEDGITGAGIRINNWFGDVTLVSNRIQPSAGAKGVELMTGDPSYNNLVIAHNSFGTDYGAGPADVAIDLGGTNTYHSIIGPNSIEPEDTEEGLGYSELGDVMTRDDSPSVENHNPGVKVFNPTDGGIYMSNGTEMVQIGGLGSDGGTLNVQELLVGDDHGTYGRPLSIASSSDTVPSGSTLYVDPNGGDDEGLGTEADPVATIQEAVDRIPAFVGSNFVIDLATVPTLPVTYDEDVEIGPMTQYGSLGELVRITGDRDTPSNVQVGSITTVGGVGVAMPTIEGIGLTRDATSITDTGALRIFNSGEMKAKDIVFVPESGTISVGITCYGGANVDARNIDVSGTAAGFESKRGSHIGARGVTGSASEHVYTATEGGQISFFDNTATGTEGLRYTVHGGQIWSDYERWRTVHDEKFTAETVSFTVPTPSFVSQGDGEMRMKLRIASNEGTNVDVNMTVTGVTSYSVMLDNPDGTRSSTTETEIPLARGIGGSFSSCTLEHTIESPRDRVLVYGNGVDRRLEASITTKASTDDSPAPGYDDISVTTNNPVTEASVKVEARRIAGEEL